MRVVERDVPVGRLLTTLAVLAALGAGCGGDGDVAAGPTTVASAAPSSTDERPPALESPPPVTVRSHSNVLELELWTYCYASGCADGMPPTDPRDVGDTDHVRVEFPLDGWEFTALFRPAGVDCPREHAVPLTPNGDGFELAPAGHAGTYDVTLFGEGNGDLFVTFRWTTRRDGPLPTPEARLAVIADHDGRPDSYGVELMLSNLASTPRRATATITVRTADGDC